jgi:hypothetical protein
MEILEIVPPRHLILGTIPTRMRGLQVSYGTRIKGKHHSYTGTYMRGLPVHTRIGSGRASLSFTRTRRKNEVYPWRIL